MTKVEFKAAAAILATAYAKEQLFPTDESIKLWYSCLRDLDYTSVHTFLQKWICSEKWSPTIADIRAGVAAIKEAEIPQWFDAWQEVLTAVRRYGLYHPQEAISSLPELTASAVRSLGWSRICNGDSEHMGRQFRTVYEAKAARESANKPLPASLVNKIKEIQTNANTAQLCDSRQTHNQKELPAHGDHTE